MPKTTEFLAALEKNGYLVAGFSGIVSASELGKQEVQKATGLPCLSSRELSEGGIVSLVGLGRREVRRKAV